MIRLPCSRAELEEAHEFLHLLAAEIGATVQAGKPFVSSRSPAAVQQKLRAVAQMILREHLLMTMQKRSRGSDQEAGMKPLHHRAGPVIARGLAPSYIEATARCATRARGDDGSTQRIGVAFDLCDGTITRLSLSVDDAIWLVGGIQENLIGSQSSMSSGMPSFEGSCPDDGNAL